MKRILFVCTGNTCRSSMAESLLRNMLEEAGLSTDFSVESAGTSAFAGQKASHNALLALEENGIDLKEHRSRLVTEKMLEAAYIVLTMTNSHKEYLNRIYPKHMGKIYTLKEYCSKSKGDILDPYGGDLKTYTSCRDEISSELSRLIELLKN